MITLGVLASAILAALEDGGGPPPGGGGSGTSATHWRIVVTLHGGSACSVSELELRETAGGADISGSVSSITASTTFDGINVAANMIDNNNATLWSSAVGSGPHTITCVFPSAVSIMELAIRSRGDAVPEQTPRRFRLESSSDSGSTWNFEMERSTPATWTLGEQRVFTSDSAGLGNAPGAHRYWRMYLYENNGSYYGFTELILREGGTNRSGSGGFAGVNASDVLNSGNQTAYAFDGNLSTSGWLTNLAVSPPQWIDGDFQGSGGYGSPVEVSSFDIYGSWNVTAASPKRFALVWSDDRLNWDVAQRYAGETSWGAAELRTFIVF